MPTTKELTEESLLEEVDDSFEVWSRQSSAALARNEEEFDLLKNRVPLLCN